MQRQLDTIMTKFSFPNLQSISKNMYLFDPTLLKQRKSLEAENSQNLLNALSFNNSTQGSGFDAFFSQAGQQPKTQPPQKPLPDNLTRFYKELSQRAV